MDNDLLESYNKYGLYGLIISLEKHCSHEIDRVKAYNLLKAGLQIAKKSPHTTLNYLPEIAFNLSRHESIYRIAGLLYTELGNYDKALECLIYLHYYYQANDIVPHKQYALIKEALINHFDIDKQIEDNESIYQELSMLTHIKEYPEVLDLEDISKQKTYFKRLYRRFGIETVLKAIENDIRLAPREKAIILIRASRTIGAIADEGSSVESLFANKALDYDTSETVVNNAYQAYLRAGDLNNIKKLKKSYAYLD